MAQIEGWIPKRICICFYWIPVCVKNLGPFKIFNLRFPQLWCWLTTGKEIYDGKYPGKTLLLVFLLSLSSSLPILSIESPGKYIRTFPSLFYITKWTFSSHFFTCSVAESCPTLCDPMDCSIPGFPVLCFLPEFAQTHVNWVGDPAQPSCPLSPCSPAFNLSQHQSLLQWINSSHQVFKVLELQLQHQSF